MRLGPRVAELAALEDPVTAALRDDTAPRMPPVLAADKAALREALDAASGEAQGLLPRLLDPQGRVVALASRFVLDRARDTFLRRPVWVRSPTWLTREADLVLAALESSARQSGACSHCDVSLAHLTEVVRNAAPTPPALAGPAVQATAAASDARALAQRVLQLPGPPQAAAAAAEALEAFATALETADASGSARLGPEALQRLLEVEENVDQTPQEAFASLRSAVGTLAAMRAKHPPAPDGAPQPITPARCEAAWSQLSPIAHAQPALDPEAFDCERFVAGVGSATLDDADLRIAIVDVAFVAPQRLAAQRGLPEVLSSIGGRLTRGAQQHTLRTALLLSQPELAQVAGRALQREADALCSTAAALWIHGELGDDDALGQRLDGRCPRETPEYIARAEARPRQALEGLALRRIPLGPAGVVPLDRLWWLPLGLVDPVAAPEAHALASEPSTPIEAHVETVETVETAPPEAP